jgi:hypothetical protein
LARPARASSASRFGGLTSAEGPGISGPSGLLVRGPLTPRPLTPQSQAFFAIDAIELVLAEISAFAPQQHENPPIAESDTRLSQLAHPISKRDLRILAAGVAIRGPAHSGTPTCPSQSHRVSTHQVAHNFTPLDGLHHFFCTTSWSITLSSERSATRRLSLVFSPRSCFSSRASEGSMPP